MNILCTLFNLMLLVLSLLIPTTIHANENNTDSSPLIDDFKHETNNEFGVPRQYIDDTMVGGATKTHLSIENGKMQLKGDIAPPRGQPGWASTVQLLDHEGKPKDLSNYSGIRLVLKINSGSLSVSANSNLIDNFDYHSSVVVAKNDGKFHEVKIPFDTMKRSWSEQTKLDKKTINSLSLVAFSLQPASFDYVIDSISFY